MLLVLQNFHDPINPSKSISGDEAKRISMGPKKVYGFSWQGEPTNLSDLSAISGSSPSVFCVINRPWLPLTRHKNGYHNVNKLAITKRTDLLSFYDGRTYEVLCFQRNIQRSTVTASSHAFNRIDFLVIQRLTRWFLVLTGLRDRKIWASLWDYT